MSDETKVGAEYYSAVQKNAMEAVKSIFDSVLYPVQYPSQGDYMWYFQNSNQDFNEGTFNYINANVSPGEIDDSISLSAANGFPNNYDQVLNSIIYSLSAANQAELDDYQKKAETQLNTVITDYQGTYGTITDEQMEEANVNTKIDYVISYIFGSIWSGKEAAEEAPITYSEMAAARNLKDLLPARPASSDTVVNDVSIYLNMMAPVNGFQDKVQNGDWVIRSLKTNTQSPNASNGGMKVFNPSTGAVSDQNNLGYGISVSLASIENDLANKSRTIEVSMSSSSSSSSEVSVSVEGEAGISIGSFLSFGASAGGTYDMTQVEGTSQETTVKMLWEGYSMVPMAPTAWNQSTNIGWYYNEPIRQAVLNEGQDVDGYKFIGDQPPFDMSSVEDGGNFGMLTNLLISNFPTIEITYTNADYSSFIEEWSEEVTGNVSLFGFISLGSFSEGAYGSTVVEGENNSTFTVTFSQSPAVVSVPSAQQTAFVIGGAVENPGV